MGRKVYEENIRCPFSMNLYVIFNNGYSGIIQSQVVNRLNYVSKSFSTHYQIVAFVPLQTYFSQREAYKSRIDTAIVLPMIGGLKWWRLSVLLLAAVCIIKRPKQIVGRAIFATGLALSMRSWGLTKRVVFDGRGAVAAEWREYLGKHGWSIPLSAIESLEATATINADHVMGVSKALFEYYESSYGVKVKGSVIPCLMDIRFRNQSYSAEERSQIRSEMDLRDSDIVLLMSASRSDWQSLDQIIEHLIALFKRNENLKLILLSNQTIETESWSGYHDRVIQNWVSPEEVVKYYWAADYGLLLREDSMTNQVAAPVKFAEYIAAGLRVFISPKIGDYSKMVLREELGSQVELSSFEAFEIKPRTHQDRERVREFALESFVEEAFLSELQFSFFGQSSMDE